MSKKKLNKKEIEAWFEELRKNYEAMPDKDRLEGSLHLYERGCGKYQDSGV